MKWYHLEGKRFGKLTVLKEGKRIKTYDRTGKPTGNRKYWICKCDCGKEHQVRSASLISGKTRSCGCLYSDEKYKRYGKRSNGWKGGRHKTGGYIKILMRNHPNCPKYNYMYEHVFVMSEHLGRPLTKNESVHHLNGIKDDNRIENLELWNSSHPSGQRVEDKLQYCLDFIKEYAPRLLN